MNNELIVQKHVSRRQGKMAGYGALGMIKRQACVKRREIFFSCAAISAAFLFGIVLMRIVILSDKSVTTYFPLGTTMAFGVYCIMAFVLTFSGLRIHFNIQISMGSTRKAFFYSFFLVQAAFNLAVTLLVWLLEKAESMLYTRIYVGMALEQAPVVQPLLWVGCAALAFAIPMVTFFICALTMRFGTKVIWGFWGLWMLLSIGIPQMHEASINAPESVLGQMGKAVFGIILTVPIKRWILFGVLICAGCFVGSYLIIRRQQVD